MVYRLTGNLLWFILLGGASVMIGIPICMFLARRGYILQMADAWIWADEWSKGRRSDIDLRVELFAEKILRECQSDMPDEILLLGHSCGTMLLTAVAARLLDLDSSLASSRSEVAMVCVGNCSPVMACNPQANRFRSSINKILSAPNLAWIEIQARKDVLGCSDFDPSSFQTIIERSVPQNRPKIVDIRLRDMLAEDFYTAHRLDFLRLHFQYIMANDCIAPYDYFRMICGPDSAPASFRVTTSPVSSLKEQST
jgi:hypothetical protein